MRRGRGRNHGTPTGEPRPQGIDDFTGFKVDLAALRKNWDGLLTTHPDIRNPQDFVRGVKDDQSLPFARPEPPDEYVAGPIIWQDGATILTVEGLSGNVVLTQGLVPETTL